MMAKKRGAGPPKGNRNAVSKKPWLAALERALKKRSLTAKREALDELAERFLQCMDEGDVQAFKEFADRLDGKVTQPVEGDINQAITIEIVRFADQPSE